MKKIMILGITGMLGHKLFMTLSLNAQFTVIGTVRSLKGYEAFFPEKIRTNITTDIDAEQFSTIETLIHKEKPDIVINCIGIIKQLPKAHDHLASIAINALLPHRLAALCQTINTRLIHFSTDCIFDGKKGNYTETDYPHTHDLYGQTKALGEVTGPNTITIRTSIIGHELASSHSLIEWFLSQHGSVHGYTRAIYSGFPTIEMAHIIERYVIPHPELCGVYHVSSDPTSKFDLLKIVAQVYKKDIIIAPYPAFFCERSLNSERFKSMTGYRPPSWPELVAKMYDDHIHADHTKTLSAVKN